MKITVTQKETEALAKVLDGFIRHVGLAGNQIVTWVQQSIEIEQPETKPEEQQDGGQG